MNIRIAQRGSRTFICTSLPCFVIYVLENVIVSFVSFSSDFISLVVYSVQNTDVELGQKTAGVDTTGRSWARN